MGIQVKPEDLEAAAKKVGAAVNALDALEYQGKQAQGNAKEIHYQPAAGKADAVAQKGTENLILARDALLGLVEGFLKAAGKYDQLDKYVDLAFQRSVTGDGAVQQSLTGGN